MAWLASAGAVAQEAGAPPGGRSADAGKTIGGPAVEGPQQAPPPAPQGQQTEQTPPPTPDELRDAALKTQAEIAALRAATESLKTQLEETQMVLGAEREQRAEEVIGLQEKAAKEHAAAAKMLKLSGYLQADWTTWRQSSEDQINPGNGDPLNDERFTIRRARLKATLDKDYVSGVLELDGNTVRGTTARLIDAEASFKIPGDQPDVPLAMLTFGLFKIPFGFEVIQSDKDRLFLERSTTERALFPGEFDLGARLSGGWRFVRYAVALQNGEPLGERTWPGRDPNSAKDLAGRLGVDTPLGDFVWIAGGFSGLKGTGFHQGTAATKPSIQWVDRNEDGSLTNGEITTSPGMAATPSLNFPRFGYGADLRVGVHLPGVGATVVYGEVYWGKNLDRGILPADPKGSLGRDSRELGGYAAVTQEIGSNLMLGVRWDYYDPDQDSTNLEAGVQVPTSFAYQTLAGVAAFVLPSGRVVVEYDHNTNKNGRDAAGNPTNLKDDAVIVRGQVSF